MPPRTSTTHTHTHTHSHARTRAPPWKRTAHGAWADARAARRSFATSGTAASSRAWACPTASAARRATRRRSSTTNPNPNSNPAPALDSNPDPNPDPNTDPNPDPNQVLARLSAGASRAGGDKGPASAGSRRPASAVAGGGGGSGSVYAEVAGGHVDHEKHKVRLRALPSGAGNLPRAREPNAADEASLYQRQLKRQRQVRPQP